MSQETSWSEERRLDLVLHYALEDVSTRCQHLEGKDKLALQTEWLEFSSSDFDDLEVMWRKHYPVHGQRELLHL